MAADQPDPLLPEELDIVRLVAHGLDNRAIARALAVPEHTVSNRLRSAFRKLGVANRTQLALHALRRGWASLDDPPE